MDGNYNRLPGNMRYYKVDNRSNRVKRDIQTEKVYQTETFTRAKEIETDIDNLRKNVRKKQRSAKRNRDDEATSIGYD